MRKLGYGALFLLPVLFLLPWLGDFPFQPSSSYSDMAISHLPNALFLRRALLEWGEIPLWSPTILSGYPFAANPLSGLYYLPGWLALAFPLPFGFNLLVILHLIFAGVGMVLFLRRLGLSEWAALFGGLAFEALPKLYGHLGAGHITLLFAIAWTPWLLLAEQRSAGSDRLRWVLPGILLGVITLADVRWLAYAGIVWIVYSFSQVISPPQWGHWMVWLASRVTNAVIAMSIAAPLLLPLAQYTGLSTRQRLAPAENFVLSLPPGQLLGLIFPIIGGSAEWVLYPGAVILALVLFAFSHRAVRRRSLIWLVLTLATLIYALGSYIPLLELLASLPGFDLLRVPPRMLFLTGFCMVVAAGYAFDYLFATASAAAPKSSGRSLLVVFAVTAFAVLFALVAWVVVDALLPRIQFAWGAVFMLVGTSAIMLGLNRRISTRTLALVLTIACLVDLIAVNRLSLDFHSRGEVFAQGQEAAEFITKDAVDTDFRVYSPSYSIPQHVAAEYHLELADGVDPLQLASYAGYMETATGVPTTGYSVTLPPFAEARPSVDNQSYAPDVARLGMLNVSYVVSEFPLQAEGLDLAAQFGSTFVYKNAWSMPRAWIWSGETLSPAGGNVTPVSVVRSPNTIMIESVVGPGLLVLSEIDYPGWQARIDGHPVEIEPVEGLLRGLRLEEGSHAVELRFCPMPVYLGMGVSGLTWLLLIFYSRVWQRSKKGGQGI